MLRLLLIVPAIALMAGVVFGAHYWLYQSFFVWTAPGDALREAGKWLFVALAATLVIQPISERTLSHRVGRYIAWPASLWMGAGFLLLVGIGFTELLWLVAGRAAEAAGDGLGAAGSEASLARMRAAAVLLVAGGAVYVGVRNAFAGPALVRHELRLPRWPEALDGFRIVQISDIHVGPILDRRFAADLTERVNALDADVVAVTGDLVDGSVSKLEAEVAPFAGLRARHGVFFVTGNHDHYSGGNAWAEQASRLGMRVLRNQRVSIEPSPGASFDLAGVDDHHSGMLPGEEGEDVEKALAGRDASKPVVLLAHDPQTFKRASQCGVDLQLSGHTHAGQIWPFNFLVRLATPFVAGHYERNGSRLYVSSGTGFWGPPMRLRTRAEITELVLRSGALSPAD